MNGLRVYKVTVSIGNGPMEAIHIVTAASAAYADQAIEKLYAGAGDRAWVVSVTDLGPASDPA